VERRKEKKKDASKMVETKLEGRFPLLQGKSKKKKNMAGLGWGKNT